MTDRSATTDSALSLRDRIDVLLEEYRALYALAEFRMASLDRRLPVAGTAITAFLGAVPLLPTHAGVLLMVAVPISLIWFVRTAINHARSFEDVLRRIEQIEHAVNVLAGEELLRFQSSHPSRGRTVGGRTGVETVGAVGVATALLLGACLVLSFELGLGTHAVPWIYPLFIAAVSASLVVLMLRWRRYRYRSSA